MHILTPLRGTMHKPKEKQSNSVGTEIVKKKKNQTRKQVRHLVWSVLSRKQNDEIGTRILREKLLGNLPSEFAVERVVIT